MNLLDAERRHIMKGNQYFLVLGSNETMVKAQLMRTSSFLACSPALGALATCIVTSKLLLPVAYVTCPESSRSHISVSGCCIIIRSQEAVTVVTSSPVCLYLEKWFRGYWVLYVAAEGLRNDTGESVEIHEYGA